MRLWHEKLIVKLPRAQLLGQHRECCALRGLGWKRPHKTVDYVFEHPYFWLYSYHCLVMREMLDREYKVDKLWLDNNYRGKRVGYDDTAFILATVMTNDPVYPEHDDAYLQECLDNLKEKGIALSL